MCSMMDRLRESVQKEIRVSESSRDSSSQVSSCCCCSDFVDEATVSLITDKSRISCPTSRFINNT